jgi:hypothetical protein
MPAYVVFRQAVVKPVIGLMQQADMLLPQTHFLF